MNLELTASMGIPTIRRPAFLLATAIIACVAIGGTLVILDCGPDGNIIRFIPPLNVSIDDLDAGIDILDAALAAYEG